MEDDLIFIKKNPCKGTLNVDGKLERNCSLSKNILQKFIKTFD